MSKKTDKILGKFLYYLSIGSVVITFLEGLLYYNAEAYPNLYFRCMLIIQNTIKAFAFKTDIGIKDVIKMLGETTSVWETVINYAYSVAIFTAPYCTLVYLYKLLKSLFRFRSRKRSKGKKGVIIFGYNTEVKALLKDYLSIVGSKKEENRERREAYKKYRIHLVAENVSNEEEMQMLKDNVVVHNVDFLKLSSEQQVYFLSQMEGKQAQCVVIFEESSARNFSLYKLFHDKENMELLHEDVKFFCRCENEGIKALMEDFHDNESDKDMEIVSIPELRVRKLLQETPLHKYYESKPRASFKDWDLHLLVIGFGKLGQQLVLQAMNQGVMSSTNKILIDVVDFKIQEKQSIFANHFDEDYVQIEEDSLSIPSDRADGEFKVRFHQMDIRYKQFYRLLQTYGDSKQDGVYTYIAICVEDEEVGVHCLSEVQRYLRNSAGECDGERVNLAIRMEMDKYMAAYLNNNHNTFQNVVVIQDAKDVITLDELIHDKLDRDAKEFNRIYNSIIISDQKTENTAVQEMTEKEIEEAGNQMWRNLKLFRRDSSRALTEHVKMKELAFAQLMGTKDAKEELERLFGRDGQMLKDCGNAWVYENGLDDFVEKQSSRELYPCVSEMSRMEHRRWCYFMASRGWRSTGEGDAGKDRKVLDREKKNVCLCTWDDLVDRKKDTCQYDLMWLLKKYRDVQKG